MEDEAQSMRDYVLAQFARIVGTHDPHATAVCGDDEVWRVTYLGHGYVYEMGSDDDVARFEGADGRVVEFPIDLPTEE